MQSSKILLKDGQTVDLVDGRINDGDIDTWNNKLNVEITSEDNSVKVNETTDVKTKTKTFDIAVNTDIIATKGEVSGLESLINHKLDSKEDVSNKIQVVNDSSTTEYPSSKAVADFVNSSVATNTATFLGNFSLEDLGLTYPATEVQIASALNSHTWPTGYPTNNDYVYVEISNPQSSIYDKVQRYKYRGSVASWGYEYTLNNSSFTAEEMAAIDSGITSQDVTNLRVDHTTLESHVHATSNPHSVTKAQVGLSKVDNTSDADKPVSTAQQNALNKKLDKTGDASNTTATFTKNSGDTSSVTSGSKLSTMFTAISNFFASLKALAFKDKVSDSDINGTISNSHIASASTWNGKADKVSGAANGNLAALDSNGNLTDSGKKASDLELVTNKVSSWQDTPDNTHFPSEKLVKDALDGKANTNNFVFVRGAKGFMLKCPKDLRLYDGYFVNILNGYGGRSYVNITFAIRKEADGSLQVDRYNTDVSSNSYPDGKNFSVYYGTYPSDPNTTVILIVPTYSISGIVNLSARTSPILWTVLYDIPNTTGLSSITPIEHNNVFGANKGSASVPVYVDANGAATPCTDDFVHDANYVHTDNNFTNTDKSKLDNIQAGAEQNVQSDWNQTDSSADNYIKNKPSIPTKDSDLTNDRYVSFDANNQGLTDAQMSNARTNIGAGTSNLELGETAFTAAYGNHQHGRLQNNGSLGDENWEVSSGDRIVIAKAEFNGKRGYLAPSAITFDSNEDSKALTQSAQWKEFLPPNGDGSSVSVTPDGTSTGYDLGSGTTLKVLAQKFKNLVNALKSLAFKDKVTDSDISGTISDSHIASASTWNAKYTKPSTGIPKGDLDSAVQESLDKADTALQRHQDISGKADKSNITGATKCKITYNSQGIVTAGNDLSASDIPNLAASKITSGTFGTARIADDAITAAKVKDNETLPVNISGRAGSATVADSANVADYLKFWKNEINFRNVPTSGNKQNLWFNYRNGDTGEADDANPLTDYYFCDRNMSTRTKLHADRLVGTADSADSAKSVNAAVGKSIISTGTNGSMEILNGALSSSGGGGGSCSIDGDGISFIKDVGGSSMTADGISTVGTGTFTAGANAKGRPIDGSATILTNKSSITWNSDITNLVVNRSAASTTTVDLKNLLNGVVYWLHVPRDNIIALKNSSTISTFYCYDSAFTTNSAGDTYNIRSHIRGSSHGGFSTAIVRSNNNFYVMMDY